MNTPDHLESAIGDAKTLWHGRFASGPADELLAYTVSLPFDRLLFREDIAGSRAHVRGLARAGLLRDDEREAVLSALDVVHAELEAAVFVFAATDEDIHTAVERRVTEIAGPAGAKLHTGRSRNDQIATDLRLFTKAHLLDVARRVLRLQRVLLTRAEQAGDEYLPGYTHLQRAQPILLAHHLLAHKLIAPEGPALATLLKGTSSPPEPPQFSSSVPGSEPGLAAGLWRTATAVEGRERPALLQTVLGIDAELAFAGFVRDGRLWRHTMEYRSIETDLVLSENVKQFKEYARHTSLQVEMNDEVIEFASEVRALDSGGAHETADRIIMDRAKDRRRKRTIRISSRGTEQAPFRVRTRQVESAWDEQRLSPTSAALTGPSGIRFELSRQEN